MYSSRGIVVEANHLLINLLVRFYDSSAGKITFDNIDIKDFIF